MYSAYIIEIDNLKRDLFKSLEFIDWKKAIKTDSTVFVKPNFTFPYYKERITTSPELLRNLLEMFGDNHGVIYVDKPENVLKKAVELIENGSAKEEGSKARRFVENYTWDSIVDEFERILEEVIKVRGGK